MTLQRLSAISVLTVKSPEHLVQVFQPSSAPRGDKRGLSSTFTRSGSSPKPVPMGLSPVGCLRTGGQKADKGRNTRSCMACALRPPTHTQHHRENPNFPFFFFFPSPIFARQLRAKARSHSLPSCFPGRARVGLAQKNAK